MLQNASGGGGALADAGSGGGRRRYDGSVEIKWGGHIYSAYCMMDSSATVTVALKDLRDIVCRSLAAHRGYKQLDARMLCQGTAFFSHSARGEMSLGPKAAPTIITVHRRNVTLNVRVDKQGHHHCCCAH